jgi:large subunit ribosomal protein L4
MQLEIINTEGKKTGRTIDLPEEVFGVEPNGHAVWLTVKQYLAAQRQGTHKVKTRAEAQGSSKKLHKQKGTGGSRKGNLRNPLYKGGGTIFGPKPHGYDIKVNRKVKELARISALSAKAKENKIIVVEDDLVKIEKPATGQFSKTFLAINPESRKSLLVLAEYDENVYKSFRNIPSISGALIDDINAYNVVNADSLVFTESAAKILIEEITEENEVAEEA